MCLQFLSWGLVGVITWLVSSRPLEHHAPQEWPLAARAYWLLISLIATHCCFCLCLAETLKFTPGPHSLCPCPGGGNSGACGQSPGAPTWCPQPRPERFGGWSGCGWGSQRGRPRTARETGSSGEVVSVYHLRLFGVGAGWCGLHGPSKKSPTT